LVNLLWSLLARLDSVRQSGHRLKIARRRTNFRS